jgi:hypothetical protein
MRSLKTTLVYSTLDHDGQHVAVLIDGRGFECDDIHVNGDLFLIIGGKRKSIGFNA